jgi:hypothetical protein
MTFSNFVISRKHGFGFITAVEPHSTRMQHGSALLGVALMSCSLWQR